MRVFTTETDIWGKQVLAGGAFAARGVAAAVAAKFSAVELFNPAGSAKVLLVRAIWFDGAGSGMFFSLQNQSGHITTLSGSGSNLLTGGALSVGQIYTDQLAAGPPATAPAIGGNVQVFQPIEDHWLTAISPGNGTIVTLQSANVAVGVSFFWVEG